MKKLFISFYTIVIIAVVIWWRSPIIGEEWNKQTIYVGLLDVCYGASKDEKAHAMWIDDDSTEGIFKVKTIADNVGIKPVFAVIADKMEPAIADSIASWQRQRAGVVLHGLRHEQWEKWNESQIEYDISQSFQRLYDQGFDTAKIIKMIIPPHGCNTRAIRKVIDKHGCQMISGACLVNPDRHVFQLGRISITSETDVETIREILRKAYNKKAFIIFGTHSSIPESFSIEKTQRILEIAKEFGFSFDF